MSTVEAALLRTRLETVGAQESESAIQRVSRAVESLKGNVIAGFAFGAGFAAFNAGLGLVKSGLEAAVNASFGFNSQLQQSTMAFTSMIGAGEKTNAFLAQMKQFAADSAFSLPQVQEASQRLLAMGFSAARVVPLLHDIGAAAIGLDSGTEGIERMVRAMGQMRSLGRVTAEDMNQLTDAGVPSWDLLSKHIGLTVAQTRKLGEEGKITAETFITAFQAWSQGKFPGIIDAYTKTWEGATSRIKDLIQQMIGGAFEPLFAWATKLATQFGEWLGSNQAARWAAAIEKAVGIAVTALQNLWQVTQPVRDALSGLFDGFADLLGIPKVMPVAKEQGKPIGDALATGIKDAIVDADPVGTAIKGLQGPLAHLKLAASDIVDAYTAVIDPLKAQVAAMAPIVDFQAQIRDLALDTEAALLREKDARESIIASSRSGLTTRGWIRHGKDPTDDLRKLDIQIAQREAATREKLAGIERDMATAPLLANIAALEAAQKTHLKPLEDQIKAMERQLALLNLQKLAVEDLAITATGTKDAIKDATAPLTGDADSGAGEFGGRVIDFEAIKARGAKMAGSLVEGFKKWWDDNFKPQEWLTTLWESGPVQTLLTRIKDGLTYAFSPEGIKAWEKWRDEFLGTINAKVQEIRPGIEKVSYEITKTLVDNAPTIGRAFLYILTESMKITLKAQTWLQEIGISIGQGIGKALIEWARANVAEVMRFVLAPPGTPFANMPMPFLDNINGPQPTTAGAAPGAAPVNVTVGQVVLKPDMTEAERAEAEKALGARVLKEILDAQQAAA